MPAVGSLAARNYRSQSMIANWLMIPVHAPPVCLKGSETKVSSLHVQAAAAHKNASPVLVRLLWVQRSATQTSAENWRHPLQTAEKYALPETPKELRPRSSLLVSHVHIGQNVFSRRPRLSHASTCKCSRAAASPVFSCNSNTELVPRETRIETSTLRSAIFVLVGDP